jgi:hypothetical protein
VHAAVVHLVQEKTLQRSVLAEIPVEEKAVDLREIEDKGRTTGRSSELWT